MLIYRLFLTAEERQTLEGWQKKYKSHSTKLQRIQILLNSDEHTGRRPAPELAVVLGCATKTVERVCRQFCEQGLAMFEPKPRKTRSDKKIDGRVEAHLTALLYQSPLRRAAPLAAPTAGRPAGRVGGGRAHLDHDGGAFAKKNELKPFQWWRVC